MDKLAVFLEAAPDAMVIVDQQGRIALVNRQAEAMFNFAREELIGRPMEILIPFRYRDAHVGDRNAYLHDPRVRPMGHAGVELFGQRKDGTEFPVEISLSPLETEQGLLVMAAIRDITERKRFEEQRRKIAEEASRLKSEFLANMSHELRTPLNAIIGFAELIHDGKVGQVSEQIHEFVGDILTSSRHLLQLINDVLDLAKVESGKMEFRPETVDPSPVVREVCDILRTLAAKKRIRIESSIDPELGELVIDAAKLKQILYNYLSNAIKFTPEEGRVGVEMRGEDPDTFRLEVHDTGIGIREEDVSRLFVEFQQLDAGMTKMYGGTGLGLALTRRIVESQGGQVGVASRPGEGSRFWAILPRVSSAEFEVVADSAARSGAAGAGLEILVVEDDPKERAWLAAKISEDGYTVHGVETGAAALELCARRPFDAITVDLQLPDMSGYELLGRIRELPLNENTPVIVASVEPQSGMAGLFQLHDYFRKPVDSDKLLSSLRLAGLDPSEQRSVLIVDDDPSILKILQTMVEQLGFQAMCHLDASSALEAAAANCPGAVILDLLMPGMDGFEFLDRLRKLDRCADVPVVVWTNAELTTEDQTTLRRSAQSIILKSQSGPRALMTELTRNLAVRRSGNRRKSQ